jgi:alpha-galactosidase
MGAAASREKVSTRATLVNTITRSCLDGICFGNDPDVVILRDEKQQMTREERHLLATLNSHLGSLVFCSDPVHEFSDWQKNELSEINKSVALSRNMKLFAVCGRPEASGVLYQIVTRGDVQSEGLQLQVNLNREHVLGVPPHSCTSRQIQQG